MVDLAALPLALAAHLAVGAIVVLDTHHFGLGWASLVAVAVGRSSQE